MKNSGQDNMGWDGLIVGGSRGQDRTGQDRTDLDGNVRDTAVRTTSGQEKRNESLG